MALVRRAGLKLPKPASLSPMMLMNMNKKFKENLPRNLSRQALTQFNNNMYLLQTLIMAKGVVENRLCVFCVTS